MIYHNMILLVVLLISACSSYAKPIGLGDLASAYITRFETNFLPHGGYSFRYETSDGQSREEAANIQPINEEESSLAVTGAYSYMGDDGKNYRVEYIADEEGYRPSGAHLPESAGVRKLGIPPAAIASLAGGGLG